MINDIILEPGGIQVNFSSLTRASMDDGISIIFLPVAKTDSVLIHDVVSGIMQGKMWKCQHRKISKKTSKFLMFYRISSAG